MTDLPMMPNGSTKGSNSERIIHFDPDFSPCDCSGKINLGVGSLPSISVTQRLVKVKVTSRMYLWCHARVCETCEMSWITEPRLVTGCDARQHEKTAAEQFWGEQLQLGRASYYERMY